MYSKEWSGTKGFSDLRSCLAPDSDDGFEDKERRHWKFIAYRQGRYGVDCEGGEINGRADNASTEANCKCCCEVRRCGDRDVIDVNSKMEK